MESMVETSSSRSGSLGCWAWIRLLWWKMSDASEAVFRLALEPSSPQDQYRSGADFLSGSAPGGYQGMGERHERP